jgi:hypothetical protein
MLAMRESDGLFAQMGDPHLGIRANLCRRAGGDQPSPNPNGDPVGELEDGLQIMFDQQDGKPSLQFLEHRHHAPGLVAAHAGKRLVKEHPRSGRKRRHDFELTIFARAQVRGKRVVAPFEPDLSECVPCRYTRSWVAASITPKSAGMAGTGLNDERNVVERAELFDLERSKKHVFSGSRPVPRIEVRR